MREEKSLQFDIAILIEWLWKGRKKIIKIGLAFLLFGLSLALLSPNEYTASTIFIPQSNKEGGAASGLGGLAQLAGVNLGNNGGGSEISPEIYGRIVSSIGYKSDLAQTLVQPIGFEAPISYSQYYNDYFSPSLLDQIKKYTLGLPSVIINLISKKDDLDLVNKETAIRQLNAQEVIHFTRISKQLNLQFNKMEGLVTLSFNMHDPLLSAQMVESAVKLLQNEVKRFKIQSNSEQLNFINARFLMKKKEFEEDQKKLALFRDGNQNISSAVALNELDRLESQRDFSFNVYLELAKQLEQTKLQASKDMPIFTIIQPVVVPNTKFGPNRALITLTYAFLGLVIGTVIVLSSAVIPYFKQNL